MRAGFWCIFRKRDEKNEDGWVVRALTVRVAAVFNAIDRDSFGGVIDLEKDPIVAGAKSVSFDAGKFDDIVTPRIGLKGLKIVNEITEMLSRSGFYVLKNPVVVNELIQC